MPDSNLKVDTVSAYRKSGAMPATPPIRIAHVSDLHFIDSWVPIRLRRQLRKWSMGDHNQDALKALESKLKQLMPDIVIASGDLATLGDRASTAAAYSFLSNVTQETCRLPSERLIVIPGNHDTLLKYCRISPSRAYDSVVGSVPIFREIEIRGFPVFVFSFDSSIDTRGEWWPFAASKGRVKPETFIKFNDEAFELRQNNPGRFEEGLKIAIVHHHPLPVPNKEFQAFTVMQNGGTFIAHMQSNGVNLVLHGHEHFPYSCTYRYDQREDPTIVVSAGTASQFGSAVNSFSFIEFQPWQKLGLRQYDYYSEAGFAENFNGSTTFWFRQ